VPLFDSTAKRLLPVDPKTRVCSPDARADTLPVFPRKTAFA